MPNQHTLAETERATARRIDGLRIDMPAARAVSSLYRAANAARSHLSSSVLSRHDLSWTGFLVLWLLWIWGRMTTSATAEAVGISKATLTGVVSTLVNRGLVERATLARDRRLVELQLSAAGMELMDVLYPQFNAAEAQVVAALDAEEVEHLTSALRKVVVQLDG